MAIRNWKCAPQNKLWSMPNHSPVALINSPLRYSAHLNTVLLCSILSRVLQIVNIRNSVHWTVKPPQVCFDFQLAGHLCYLKSVWCLITFDFPWGAFARNWVIISGKKEFKQKLCFLLFSSSSFFFNARLSLVTISGYFEGKCPTYYLSANKWDFWRE